MVSAIARLDMPAPASSETTSRRCGTGSFNPIEAGTSTHERQDQRHFD